MSTLSSFPSIQAPSIQAPSLDDDVSQPQTDTGRALEAQIQHARRQPLPAGASRRTKPRFSVAELNAAEPQVIAERMAAEPHDERPVYVKALDTLDVSRNTIANLIAGHPTFKGVLGTTATGAGFGFALGGPVGAAIGGGLALAAQGAAALAGVGYGGKDRDEITEGKEGGVGGQPKIYFSDLLKHAGVQNHIVRGLVGFAGDVALDPLSYVGAIGGVAKLTNGLGHTVEAAPSLIRELRGVDEAVAGGRYFAAEHGTTGQALDLLGHTQESLAAGGKGSVSKMMLGDVQGGKFTSKVVGPQRAAQFADTLSRVPAVGAGVHGKGGLIAEYLDKANEATEGIAGLGRVAPEEAAKAQAARLIMQEHGLANVLGPKIGGPGAMIAHIPFSGRGAIPAMGVQVRGGGLSGRMSRQTMMLASAGKGIADRTLSEHTNQLAGLTAKMGDAHDGYLFARERQAAALDPQAAEEAGRVMEEYATERDAIAKQIDAVASQIRTPITPHNPNDILAVKPILQSAEDMKTLFGGEAKDATALLKKRTAIRAEIDAHAALAGTDTTAHDLSHLSDENRAIAEMTDHEAKVKSADRDWFGARAEAAMRLSEATQGSVRTYMDKADADMFGVAARMLGTDDLVMGTSIMARPKAALEKIGMKDSTLFRVADMVDKGWERVFDRNNGALAETGRWVMNTMTGGKRQRQTDFVEGAKGALIDILTKHGLDPMKDIEKAATTAHLLALDSAVKDLAAAGIESSLHTTEFGSNGSKPAQWLEDLNAAQQAGFFSKDATGAFMDDLRGFATGEYGLDLLKTLGEYAKEDEVLGNTIKGGIYFPMVPTEETNLAIRNTAKNALAEKGAPTRQAKTQPFQRARQASLEYRFKSNRPGFEGQERRFFAPDLALLGEADPDHAAYLASKPELKDLADDIAEWAAMPNRPAPKYLAPSDFNKLDADGRFSMLTGKDKINSGFFDTNLISAIAQRVGQHEKAVAGEFWRQYTRQFGVALKTNLQGKMGMDGQSVTLRDGTVARTKVLRALSGEEVRGIEYGGQLYRPLSQEARDTNAIEAFNLAGDEALIYHVDVADKMERMIDSMKPENAHFLLKLVDAATKEWKNWTLFHPAWTIFNLLGDHFNGHMGGARIADMLKNVGHSAKIAALHDNPEALRGMKLSFPATGEITGEDLWNHAVAGRVTEPQMRFETPSALVSHGLMGVPSAAVDPGVIRSMLNPMQAARNVGTDYKRTIDLLANSVGSDKPGLGEKIIAGDYVWDSRRDRWFLGPWYRANQKVNNFTRLNVFMSHLEQGNDLAAAARKTIESQLDYSSMTATDKAVFRRLFPFWAWVKGNGALQIKRLLDRPIYAGSFPLLQNAIEEAIDGESRLPTNMRPRWMQQSLALQIGSAPDDRMALLLGSAIPTEQALQAILPFLGADGRAEFLHTFANNLNPIPKSLLEVGTGHDFYSGQAIDPDPLLSETSKGASDLIRPIREAQRVSQTYQEQGAGPAVGRALLGGRLQPMSDDRTRLALVRQYRDEIEKLQTTVRRAEFKGDAETSQAARVRIMQAYEAAAKAGVGDQVVPRWARASLAAPAVAGP